MVRYPTANKRQREAEGKDPDLVGMVAGPQPAMEHDQ